MEYVKNVQVGPYAGDQQEISRQRKLAEMLQAQSMEPLQSSQGVPISPLQVAAKLMQGYASGQKQKAADEKQKSLAERQQQERQAALAKALQQGQGSPQPDAALGGGPAMPPDPMGAAGTLMGAPDADLQKMGGSIFAQQMKPPQPPQPQLVTTTGPDGKPRQSWIRPGESAGMDIGPKYEKPDAQDKWSEPYQMGGAWVQKNASTGQVRQAVARENPQQGSTPAPFYQFLPTATGYHAGNSRTGTAAPVMGADGKPIVRATDSPGLQGDIAGARETGRARATRAFNMSGIGQTLDRAEKLLQGIDPETGRSIDKPTGSGFGTIVDSVAGFVGYSPDGAPEAEKLRSVGAALTSKMPRMEGPQSDRDVQLYREAAAQVGDSNIPRARRLAALQDVRNLWAKYEHLNQSEFGGGNQGGSLSPQEQQELDQLRQRFGR